MDWNDKVSSISLSESAVNYRDFTITIMTSDSNTLAATCALVMHEQQLLELHNTRKHNDIMA